MFGAKTAALATWWPCLPWIPLLCHGGGHVCLLRLTSRAMVADMSIARIPLLRAAAMFVYFDQPLVPQWRPSLSREHLGRYGGSHVCLLWLTSRATVAAMFIARTPLARDKSAGHVYHKHSSRVMVAAMFVAIIPLSRHGGSHYILIHEPMPSTSTFRTSD